MADIFDKVKQGINKGISSASEKSKEMLEVAKLKGQISTIQQQKKIAIEELGNIVYTIFIRNNSFDEARQREKCEVILKIDDQIKELENEIIKVRAKTKELLGIAVAVGKCACGAEIFEDTKFCGSCGQKIKEYSTSVAVESSSQKDICSKCGVELQPEAKFCYKCGSKI